MPPKNATIRGDGFRMYAWPGADGRPGQDLEVLEKYHATEASDLLSVTSIRSLAGEPYQLVAWKIANVVNLAMGVRKATKIGPRGGVKEVYVKDGPFPGEFVTRMIESRGDQGKLDDNRKWLRSTADEPRDIAAVRGTIVHKLIELNAPLSLVDEDLVRQRFAIQWAEEKRKVKPDVTAEDVSFVINGMRQYWDMRLHTPFVVVAQEPQVYNLTAGYGGSADAIIWFLGNFERGPGEDNDGYDPNADYVFVPLPGYDPATPEGLAAIAGWQKAADKGTLTLAQIKGVGGDLTVGDWKTAKGVYTNHVIQTEAYMSAEFVAEDGIIDVRLSDILEATTLGLVIHIRPNFWAMDVFEWRQDIMRAFLGSVAFSRFLAMHKTPDDLFILKLTGVAPGTDESEVVDDDSE
jgi:hypothetical protein